MSTNPANPSNYITNCRGELQCKDCGREGWKSRSVKHSPRCDIAPGRTIQVAHEEQADELPRARPEKLASGEWGARVTATSLKVGDRIQVTTRAGKTWAAVVVEVLEVAEVTSLVRTSTGSDAAVRSGEVPASGDDVLAAFERGAISMSAAMNRDF